MPDFRSNYAKTYTSFSGADIVASFGSIVIGSLEAITYSVTREKAPIYVMGDPNPKSYSRGKRGIAGSLVFTVFDRDALKMMKDKDHPVYREGLNTTEQVQKGQVLNAFDQAATVNTDTLVQKWQKPAVPDYSDEIPPFDVTVTFLNEYGQSSKMTIYGVEILNEGMGMSIDDIKTEKACTFVARAIDDMAPGEQGTYAGQ